LESFLTVPAPLQGAFSMRVTFWGVRGSIPTPGQGTVRYGGNTSCIAADFGSDIVVFDAGTGIRLLGEELMKRTKKPRIHLFLSHVHWDHIQGFPFFMPAYSPGFSIVVHGRGQADQTLGQILAGQMEGPNFPVSLDQLDAQLAYRDLAPGNTTQLLGADGQVFAEVQCIAGNHPNGVLIYRLQDLASGHSLVYATDTEHTPGKIDERLVQLGKASDLLVYDGMYTPEEYEARHRGWGHSTWEQGLLIAARAQIKQYVVFHHDPSHDDAFLDRLKATVILAAEKSAPGVECDLAREGLTLDL
jgi:phosphoribosyl 1,2-cyclic phosphodiesterase